MSEYVDILRHDYNVMMGERRRAREMKHPTDDEVEWAAQCLREAVFDGTGLRKPPWSECGDRWRDDYRKQARHALAHNYQPPPKPKPHMNTARHFGTAGERIEQGQLVGLGDDGLLYRFDPPKPRAVREELAGIAKRETECPPHWCDNLVDAILARFNVTPKEEDDA